MTHALLCIAFTLFAYQSINADSSRIMDGVQAGLAELTKKVQQAIDLAIDRLQQAYNKLLEFSKSMVESTRDQIESIVQKVLEQVKTMQKYAVDTGVNMLECPKKPKHTLLSLPDITIKKVVSCVDNQIQKGSSIFDNGKKEIDEKISVVSDMTSEFGKCGIDVFCLASVLTTIGTASIAIPIQIAKSGLQVVDAIARVQTELADCGVQSINKLVQTTGDIVAGITKCIQGASSRRFSVRKFPASPRQLNNALRKTLNL